MRIIVIDGQGGGLGKNIITRIKRENELNSVVVALGTNSAATEAMLKAGANVGATGENAIIYNCKSADIILGAIGIGFANSMHGEISPAMAAAVSDSSACKIFIPMSNCSVNIMGVIEKPMSQYIDEMVAKVRELTLG